MFKIATGKTSNLLASGYAYPRDMITNFAKADDEATRTMFRNLYDESQDLAARVDAFRTASEEMRLKYDDGTWRNHYQNTNAIFTEVTGLEKRSLASKYLHFHCPEKIFIYDSRAKVAIRIIVKRPDKKILSELVEYDAEYGDFVCRMLELQKYLDEKLGVHEKPRSIDSFLLSTVK